MQNNNPSIIDLEFEISGEKLGELEWETVNYLGPKSLEIAQAIHKVILKKAWEIVSLEELRCQIIKNLHFIDLVKIKMDFSEKGPIRSKRGCFYIGDTLMRNRQESQHTSVVG